MYSVLMAQQGVKPAGLGARDSLRLEVYNSYYALA